MAYVHSAVTARDILTAEPAAARKTGKPGVLRRLMVAIQDARLRTAEREIGLYLARTGGKFTDEGEREIERRFISHHGW